MSSGTTELPCACCEGRLPVQMLCRQRGGFASLVGCQAFLDPDVPPNKYRKFLQTGTDVTKTYPIPPGSCAGIASVTTTCVYTGQIQFDPATGIPAASGNTTCNDGTGPVVTPQTTGCPDNPASLTNCLGQWSVGSTVASRSCTANCCEHVSGIDDRKCFSDNLTLTLSDPDTEADAILRLMAGTGAVWGSWLATGDGVHGCLPQECCLAQWSVRTTGFDIAYNEDQYRIASVSHALAALTSYDIKVEISRRPFVGPFEPYLTRSYTVTTDINGDFTTFDDNVPNDEGFQTYSASAYAVLTP